jgi:hypothetical protein
MSYQINLGLPTFAAFDNTASGALTANTRKDIMSLDHPVSSVKTMRITRIEASWNATTALAGDLRVYLFKGVLQATAGTVTTANVNSTEFSASDTVFRINPTITAATLLWSHIIGTVPAVANSVLTRQVLYDIGTQGKQEDFILKKAAVEGFAIAIQSNAAINWTPFLNVYFIEE